MSFPYLGSQFYPSVLGFGKSIVYQLSLLFFNETHPDVTRVITIEPTVGLVKNSISKLKTLCPDLPAVHLTPATLPEAKSATYIFSITVIQGLLKQKLTGNNWV